MTDILAVGEILKVSDEELPLLTGTESAPYGRATMLPRSGIVGAGHWPALCGPTGPLYRSRPFDLYP